MLARGGVQAVFFPWVSGGEVVLWCRVSAAPYNVVEDYERLARAVLEVKREEGV